MDDDDYDDMSEGDRAAAEAELRRRDREEGRLDGRMRRGLLYDDDDDDDEPARRRRRFDAETNTEIKSFWIIIFFIVQ